jgi:hypothetical protein
MKVPGPPLDIDSAPATIVGVMPPTLQFPSKDVLLWEPPSRCWLSRHSPGVSFLHAARPRSIHWSRCGVNESRRSTTLRY